MRTSLNKLKWGNFNLIEGDFISTYARTYGEWSEVEVEFFRSILEPHHNAIEVGSNIGMHAIPIASKISQGKLFCFEPQRPIFQVLCSNIVLNQLTNVYTYNQGVSDDKGEIEISSSNYENSWNYGSFSIDQGFNTEGTFEGEVHKEFCEIVTIDEHSEIQKLPHLQLLKIDAEGFDLHVLRGARKTIEKHHPIIFVEAHLHQANTLIEYLNSINYECYWFASDRYQEKKLF